ncbi:TPA: hypothetical protein ACH3X2_011228 [Trebouxia sp. C0005]
MKQRFGDNEQTILARVTHRKQRGDTNVQSFADEMNMLYSKQTVPGAMKIDIRILIDNLKPALHAQVEATIPKTLEQVVENAVYLEKQAVGAVTDRLKLWEQQHKSNSSDPIERITKFMEKVTLAMNNNFRRNAPCVTVHPPTGPHRHPGLPKAQSSAWMSRTWP